MDLPDTCRRVALATKLQQVASQKKPYRPATSLRIEHHRWAVTDYMSSGLRKLALTAHVVSSVGLLGSIATFLALAVAGLTTQDAPIVRGAYLAMDLSARFVVVPLSFAALLTGLVMSLGTSWGLFRHYWVLVKFVLTAFTIVVLLLQMEGISYMATLADDSTLAHGDLRGLRSSIRTHAAGGLLVLIVITTLSVFKPRGMTRYGWRKHHEGRAPSQS